VRATATANPSTNVYLSAYTGGGHFVIVAINLGATSVSQPFQLQNGTVTSLTPYQTTAASGIAQQTAVPVTDQQFTYTLPAQSIVTFVQ
jgi:glucuronoarabinoxylan endo-1,4-beta-xylanase